jgi:hypothetical protein
MSLLSASYQSVVCMNPLSASYQSVACKNPLSASYQSEASMKPLSASYRSVACMNPLSAACMNPMSVFYRCVATHNTPSLTVLTNPFICLFYYALPLARCPNPLPSILTCPLCQSPSTFATVTRLPVTSNVVSHLSRLRPSQLHYTYEKQTELTQDNLTKIISQPVGSLHNI